MVLRSSIPVATAVCLGAKVSAQSLAVPRGTTEVQIVTAAETDGAAFPRLNSPPDATPVPRKCVVGTDLGPARSGEFTIGGNLGGSAAMRAGRPGKVWWAPLHYAADMPPLVVRGRSSTTPRDTVWYTTSRVAWPVTAGSTRVPAGGTEILLSVWHHATDSWAVGFDRDERIKLGLFYPVGEIESGRPRGITNAAASMISKLSRGESTA